VRKVDVGSAPDTKQRVKGRKDPDVTREKASVKRKGDVSVKKSVGTLVRCKWFRVLGVCAADSII
jgi:hypothetical protein